MNEAVSILRKVFIEAPNGFTYPLQSRPDTSYYHSLKSKLQQFHDNILGLPNSPPVLKKAKNQLPEIQILSQGILNTIHKYLWGSHVEANKQLNLLFDEPFLKENISLLTTTLPQSKQQTLFRARYSTSTLLEQTELFHIPFRDRHLVRTHRFSIAGTPCLYLGSSIFACWLELDKPPLSDIYVAGYRIARPVKILDLAYNLSALIAMLEGNLITEDEFLLRLTMWPLVMACSYRVKYPTASFHEEYVLSGILLEWIAYQNQDIKGLQYLSTKVDSLESIKEVVNYVFPPQRKEVSNYFCPELLATFTLTNPLSWELLTLIPPVDVVVYGDLIKSDTIENALLKYYGHSKFGLIEKQIALMEFEHVSTGESSPII